MLKRIIIYILPLLLWLFLVFHFSFQPFSQQDLTPRMASLISEQQLQEYLPEVEFNYGESFITYKKPFQFGQFFIRKSVHVFVYAVLALLTLRCLVNNTTGLNGKRLLWYTLVSFAFITGVASVDELIQSFNFDRSGMIQDVFLDMFGGMIGIAIYRVILGISFKKGYI